jgi:hypothetical protein
MKMMMIGLKDPIYEQAINKQHRKIDTVVLILFSLMCILSFY